MSLFSGTEWCRKSDIAQALLLALPGLVFAKPAACAVSRATVWWRPARPGQSRDLALCVRGCAAWRRVVTVTRRRLSGRWRGCAVVGWTPNLSSHNVHLHSHQPDPPNKCGRGAHEARWEAFRNRLLQKQSRRLAERRVSDPSPPGVGSLWGGRLLVVE